MLIGFDRPATLAPTNQIKSIEALDPQLSECSGNSTKCTKQFYRLQLPSSGIIFKTISSSEDYLTS